jgi:hypothetical protein
MVPSKDPVAARASAFNQVEASESRDSQRYQAQGSDADFNWWTRLKSRANQRIYENIDASRVLLLLFLPSAWGDVNAG